MSKSIAYNIFNKKLWLKINFYEQSKISIDWFYIQLVVFISKINIQCRNNSQFSRSQKNSKRSHNFCTVSLFFKSYIQFFATLGKIPLNNQRLQGNTSLRPNLAPYKIAQDTLCSTPLDDYKNHCRIHLETLSRWITTHTIEENKLQINDHIKT